MVKGKRYGKRPKPVVRRTVELEVKHGKTEVVYVPNGVAVKIVNGQEEASYLMGPFDPQHRHSGVRKEA